MLRRKLREQSINFWSHNKGVKELVPYTGPFDSRLLCLTLHCISKSYVQQVQVMVFEQGPLVSDHSRVSPWQFLSHSKEGNYSVLSMVWRVISHNLLSPWWLKSDRNNQAHHMQNSFKGVLCVWGPCPAIELPATCQDPQDWGIFYLHYLTYF